MMITGSGSSIEDFLAAHSRQMKVEHDARGALVAGALEEFGAAREGLGLHAGRAQQALQRGANRFFIVDDGHELHSEGD
jgi:hypothetical protein